MLADNLERLAAIGIAFAGFMAGRWVAAFVAAQVATLSLSGALTFLRGALIRTGIGALIVGAGELIYQFTRLVSAAGGLGAALSLLGDVAREAWDRLSLSAGAAWARVEAGWAGAQAAILDGLQATVVAVTGWANTAVGIFQGAYDAVKAIWGALPQAIGDFAFQAANGLISGVEAMLNGVVRRINGFIEGLNAALSLLPDWATGEGGIRIGTLDAVDLVGIENPYAGAAAAAGTAAADAFRTAMERSYIDAPDLFGGMAETARTRAAGYAEAAGMLADAAARPMTAWERLWSVVTGSGQESEAALADAAGAAGDLGAALGETGGKAAGAGAAARDAGTASKEGAEEAATGWRAAAKALADYARDAMETGQQIGSAMVSAFKGAEDALVTFVTTGKLDFSTLANSILADITRIAIRSAILGPLANALGGFVSGGGLFAGIFHQGGMVGGPAPGRLVPAAAFAGAPRYHNGGYAGLRPDEVPAILQRGEMVLSRAQLRAIGQQNGRTAGQSSDRRVQIVINITTPDANSFRLSQGQILADARRAMTRAARNT